MLLKIVSFTIQAAAYHIFEFLSKFSIKPAIYCYIHAGIQNCKYITQGIGETCSRNKQPRKIKNNDSAQEIQAYNSQNFPDKLMLNFS